MKENFCRVCRQFFCCKSCRSKHEINEHKIHPECDICVYGITFIKTPCVSLLTHFLKAHWPLHCIKCKKQFITTAELKIHKKCYQEEVKCDNESPSLAGSELYHKNILTSNSNNYRMSVTTSTPMQNNNELDFLGDIEEVITPVDYVEKNKQNCNENIGVTPNMSEQLKSNDVAPKRRVTFSETPYNEHSNFKKSKGSFSSVLKKHNLTDATSSQNTLYLTATDTSNANLADINEQDETNETMWESALTNTQKIFQANESGLEISEREITSTVEVPNNDNKVDPLQEQGIWSSVTSIIKTVFQGSKRKLNSEAKSDELESVEETEMPLRKKIKLSEKLECRKNIHPVENFRIGRRRKNVKRCEKGTQTE